MGETPTTSRRKCFTGCWTCRRRRVKCGQEKPVCQRCRQLGVECEGYGVRLHWVPYNPDSPAAESIEQRTTRASRSSLAALTTAARHAPPLASPELDNILDRIDDYLDQDAPELALGAFSVFSSKSPPATPVAFDSQPLCTPEPEYQLRPADDSLPLADSLLAQDRHDEDVVAQDSCGPARHLDALTMPTKQKRLIHHWITFTSSKLVLLDEPQNPCRTLMLPMALKGLVSVAESSNADVAIFHAVCASAAYNLYELGGRASEDDHVLALRHDHQAIHHLRHNLAETNPHRAQSVAMAIMACIAVEAVSGTTERWRTHVSGGLAYLARLFSQAPDKQLLSPFRHHMVKMAILCNFIVPADLKSFLDDVTDMAVELEFTFPYYGVSRSFLRRQDYINSLIAASNQSSQSAEEADAFELQMYLDFPSIPPPGLACTSSETHGLVVHHAAKAFYYAQLVYFQRSFRGSPLSAVQDLVGLGVTELESIGRDELGCVMLWPAIVLGSESGNASNQARVSSWFRSQRRLGFRNLVVLEDLIRAVWEARSVGDAEGRAIGWRDIAAQNPVQFDVFRL